MKPRKVVVDALVAQAERQREIDSLQTELADRVETISKLERQFWATDCPWHRQDIREPLGEARQQKSEIQERLADLGVVT